MIAPLSGEQAALHFTEVNVTDSAAHPPQEYRPLIAEIVDRSQQHLPSGAAVRSAASAVDRNKSKSATPLVDSAQPTSASQNPKKAAAQYLAAKNARSLAGTKAKNGEIASAYVETLSAWESLRDCAFDKDCRSMSAELLKDLEFYGEKLSAQQVGLPPNTLEKPIRFE